MWSVCRWLSQWWLVYVLLGAHATLSDGYGIWEHFFTRVTPRLCGWLYGLCYIKLSTLALEHNAVVMTAGSKSRRSQTQSHWQEFSISVQRIFEILVEDSDTGGPISLAGRMKYLFVFQFWCCELCFNDQWGGGRNHCFVLSFILWRCFNRRWVRRCGAR